MENNELRLNKAFKFNSSVFVAVVGDFGDFRLIKGRVSAVREFKTAFSKVIYTIETLDGRFEVLPCNIFESVEEFIADVPQRVIGK